MKLTTDAWLVQWDYPSDFTLQLQFEAPTEEARHALLDAMRDRVKLKITVEVEE